ncbi:Fic family protein [Guyparkeria sp. 1SP6A2]|nr:Fic family protein [Guyparkeria sp. 1SP6A2]
MTRYTVDGSEGEYEPGSNALVLKNKLGITDPAEMQDAETELLLDLYTYVFGSVSPEQRLTVALIKEWHRKWLGNLFDWAGEERSVNMTKGGFLFAAAGQVPQLLEQFERASLAPLTPCYGMDRDAAAVAIAEVHVEFILIHPFREGNGRIARLVADVMASQAGLGQLDYTPWEREKEGYVAAIHAGLDRDYGPMTEWVKRALAA